MTFISEQMSLALGGESLECLSPPLPTGHRIDRRRSRDGVCLVKRDDLPWAHRSPHAWTVTVFAWFKDCAGLHRS